MPFDCALIGPVPDSTRTRASLDYLHRLAPPIMDLDRDASACVPGQILITKNGHSIRVADNSQATAVDQLVTRMYSSRGYRVSNDGAARASSLGVMTLEALQGRTTIGTLTINLGGRRRLNAEALYATEIAPYRRPSRRLCEFNRLALHIEEANKEVLATIFHVGIIIAHRIYGASDLFIEVNPRHAPFYRRKIGFTLVGEERVCPRVNAPAVLLHKDLDICADELSRLGGLRTPSNKSFYAFALTPTEERVVLANLAEPLRMAS